MSPLPAGETRVPAADLLRITVELLPSGREDGALVISRGTLPVSNLADLAKAVGGPGD